ncbi:MAG: hypothetical protein Q8S18_07530 [Bacteroidales bacterium]|nr:hypothetical protein [Bacteroidales bacterium]
MIDKLSKYVSWVMIGLMVVSVALGLLFYSSGITESVLLRWGYILLVIAVIVAVVSPIFSYIQNPKNAVKLLLSLGIIVLVAIIAYSFSGNSFSNIKLEQMNITAQTSRLVGMGLLFTYITAGFAILAVIYSSISKLLK